MQRISTFIGSVLAVVAVVALAIFAFQNTQSIQMSFLGATFAGTLAAVASTAAVVALVVAFLLLLPSRVTAGRRSAALSTQYAQREKALTSLREAHIQLGAQHEIVLADFTRLRDEHGRIAAERDDLLARLAPAAPSPSAMPAEAPEAAQDTVVATQMDGSALMAGSIQVATDAVPELVGEDARRDIREVVREDVVIAQTMPVGGALPILDIAPAIFLATDPAQDVVLVSSAPAVPAGAALASGSVTAGTGSNAPEALVTAES